MCNLKTIVEKVWTRHPPLEHQGKDIPSPRLDIPAPIIQGNQVVLDLKKPKLYAVWTSNSMEPGIDVGHCIIAETEFTQDEIRIGLVIVHSGGIIHRVCSLGADAEGWFCKTWGDNNTNPDPHIIRFNDIEAIVICSYPMKNFYFASGEGD